MRRQSGLSEATPEMSWSRKPSEAGGTTGGEGSMGPRYWDHLTEVGITAGLLVRAEAMEGAG